MSAGPRLQDCADMQDKLDGLNAREARQASIKGRHTQLQAGASGPFGAWNAMMMPC